MTQPAAGEPCLLTSRKHTGNSADGSKLFVDLLSDDYVADVREDIRCVRALRERSVGVVESTVGSLDLGKIERCE